MGGRGLCRSRGSKWVSVSGPLPVRLQMLFRVAAMTEKTMANPDIVGLEAAAATLPEEDSADEAELDELHMRQFLAMSVGLAVACMPCLKIRA